MTIKEEEMLSRQIAQYCSACLPADVFATTFPAGGGGALRGIRLRAAGMMSGVPDWLLIHQGQIHGIELKAKKGTVSPAQKICHRLIEQAGGYVAIVRNFDEFREALERWRIPTLEARANTVSPWSDEPWG